MSQRAAKAKSLPDAEEQAGSMFSFVPQPGPWMHLGPLTAHAAGSMLLGVDVLEAALRSWRSAADLSRAMMREQQDMAFRTWRRQLAEAAGIEQEASSHESMFWPVSTAMRSYEQMTDAVLQAQRSAFETLASSKLMH